MAFWDKWFSGKSAASQQVPEIDAAIATGNLHDIQKALSQGANPNLSKQAGVTPLHLAIKSNNSDVIKLLLDAGGNVNVFNQAAADEAITAVGDAGPAIEAPAASDPVTTDDDIKVRKPLTFKRKA